MNKLTRFGFLLLAAALGASAWAAAPDAPQLTVQAYVNGKLNVGIWWDAQAYPAMSAGTTLLSAGLSYDVQMKGPGETEFSDVTGSWDTFNKNSYVFRCWYLATNYVGAATLRLRARSADGLTSDWVETDPLAATVNVTGTLIAGDGCGGGTSAVDGRIASWIDATGNNGDDKWVGYLFDRTTRVKGIRYLPRIDHLALPGRYRQSVFQIASDASFSGATTIHTVPSGYSDITRMAEVMFDEPVSCKAIRHWKAKGGYDSTAEFEIIPADAPFRPEMSIGYSDVTNFYPVITWTMPAGAASTVCRLQRSYNSDGPFTTISEDLDPATDALTYTDTNTYVGVTVYYRVTGDCQHPSFQGQTIISSVASAVRARRLDRAWGNETQLLSGVTVLPGTNGVMRTGLKDHTRCFDGNTSTWVDEYDLAALYPPIGLHFSEKAWVTQFGYICRNDNACYSRIKNARLYAADDYPALTDRTVVSGNPTQCSQSTTFYLKDCSQILGEGATCYFLFGTSEFYGNVAEVMFFGWTASDIASAPVVTAPLGVTFQRNGTALDVSWSAGNNASSYRLERRVRGAEAWTTLVEQSATLERTYEDANLDPGYYEYRVTSVGDLGTASSDAFLATFYRAASGTGLSGVAMWPYSSTTSAPVQVAHECARGPEAVNFSLSAGSAWADGVTEHVRLAWEGKIVVPFAGSYTFTLDTDAGGAVFIDDASVANSWTDGTKAPSGAVSLTAGEHAIRVDYRPNEAGLPYRCVLSWSGAVNEEVVPASQLIPAAQPPSAKVDDWTVQFYGLKTCGHVQASSDGTYRVTSDDRNLGTLAKLNVTALMKPWRGAFDMQVYVAHGNADGKGGIFVQNAAGEYLFTGDQIAGALGLYGQCTYDPSSGGANWLVPFTQYGDSSQWNGWVRLTRTGRTFTMYWKRNASDAWTEVNTWTDTTGRFGLDVYLGLAVYGTPGANPAQFVFSQVSVNPLDRGTRVIFH